MKAPRHHSNSEERDYLRWYLGTASRPFDPTPLVQAAVEQWAHRPELITALARCSRQWPQNDQYTWLYDRAMENRIGRQWRNAGGQWLTCPPFGELLVDLRSNIADPTRFAIAGIEFMDHELGPGMLPVPYNPRMRVVR
ncbi:MAG: hypothetical protein ABI599_04660 [Flavobacteriales bacterium]